MKGQRGSILIGVLAMSLIMTVAAGGMMFVAANSGNDEQGSAENLTLHYTAESGIYLGLKWIRGHDSVFHDTHKAETMVLTLPEDGYDLIDGINLRVVLKPHPDGLPKRTLETTAFYDGAKDTLVVKWAVEIRRALGLDSLTRSRSILSQWQESYLPGSS
jgi:hypothetical protein